MKRVAKILFVWFLFLVCVKVNAQEQAVPVKKYFTFEIKSNTERIDQHKYRKALANVDLDYYRFQKERRLIKFEDGTTVMLYSKEEIKNPEIESPVRKLEKEDWKTEPIFRLTENGKVISSIPIAQRKFEKYNK